MAPLVRCTSLLAASVLALVVGELDARAASTCKIPGFDVAAFGDTNVDMQNGDTDSYDSGVAPYGTANCTSVPATCVGGVGTNGTGSSAITVGPGGTVLGTCTIGYGGSASSAPASKCNSTAVQSGPITLSSVTVPPYPSGGAIPFPSTITPRPPVRDPPSPG